MYQNTSSFFARYSNLNKKGKQLSQNLKKEKLYFLNESNFHAQLSIVVNGPLTICLCLLILQWFCMQTAEKKIV